MSGADRKPMTVRELQSILDGCDPEATVQLNLPAFMLEADEEALSDQTLGFASSVEFVVSPGFLGSSSWAEGAKPNHVDIELGEASAARLLEARRADIQRLAQNAEGGEAYALQEPAVADADSVILEVRLSRELHQTVRKVLWDVNRSDQVRHDGACTHGVLTTEGLLEMLAQDVAMVETRPGSWEGAGMTQVLAAHGYNY